MNKNTKADEIRKEDFDLFNFKYTGYNENTDNNIEQQQKSWNALFKNDKSVFVNLIRNIKDIDGNGPHGRVIVSLLNGDKHDAVVWQKYELDNIDSMENAFSKTLLFIIGSIYGK